MIATTSFYYMARGFLSFDTSSIPPSATVLAATFNLAISSTNFENTDNDSLEVVSASQGTVLAVDDVDRVGNVSFASRALSSLQQNEMNSLTVNSSGLAAIVKGGTTQLGLRMGRDLFNQRPTGASQIQTAFNTPSVQLVVTYRP